MPRETAAQRKQREAEENAQAAVLQDFVADPMEAVRPFLAQAGVEESEVLFYLYRVVNDGKNPDNFLFKCKPEDYDPEKLGQSYGSGTYRMKVYVKDDEHPNGVIRAAPKFGIEMPANWKPGSEPAPTAQQAAPLTAEAIALAVAAALKSAAPPVPTRKEMLEEIAMMAGLFKSSGPVVAEAPKAKTLMESLTEYKLLKDLFSDGGGSGETPLMEKLALKGVDFFTMAAQQRSASAPGNAPASPALSAPAEVQPEFTPEQEEELILARIAMRRACAAAIAKKSAKEFAADNYSDVPEGLLVTISCAPDWFEQLCAFYPDAAPHREWFDLVRLELIQFGVEDGLLTKQANGSITPNIGKGELNQDAISVPASAPVLNQQPADAGSDGKPAD